MLDIGLHSDEKARYEALLFSSHRVNVKIQILNLNHVYIGDISNQLIEGQVDFDDSSDIKGSLKFSVFDPHNSMDITSDSPNEGAAFMDRMVKVIYSIAPPDGTIWYDCPIFCGPMTKVDRNEDIVSIECQSKEYLAFVSVYNSKTYKRGRRRTTVIKDILQDYGETRFIIPNLNNNLKTNLAVSDDSVPWTVCLSLASSLGRRLFYDARGNATLRQSSLTNLFTFGPARLTGKPQIGYSTDGLINSAKVVGQARKGKGKAKAKSKKKPYAKYRAPISNPLSPYALGRNNKPRDYMTKLEDGKLMSNAACRLVARRLVAAGLIEAVELAFDSVIVPHLELGDVVKVSTGQVTAQSSLKKMSWSLTSAAASYGYNKNLSPDAAAIRRFKK